jgi:hypothetical protein
MDALRDACVRDRVSHTFEGDETDESIQEQERTHPCRPSRSDASWTLLPPWLPAQGRGKCIPLSRRTWGMRVSAPGRWQKSPRETLGSDRRPDGCHPGHTRSSWVRAGCSETCVTTPEQDVSHGRQNCYTERRSTGFPWVSLTLFSLTDTIACSAFPSGRTLLMGAKELRRIFWGFGVLQNFTADPLLHFFPLRGRSFHRVRESY